LRVEECSVAIEPISLPFCSHNEKARSFPA